MKPTPPLRVLAIAPGTRHLGYAVLEGRDLVRFGVKTFPGRKRCPKFLSGACAFLESITQTYHPKLVAIEVAFYAQAKLSPMLGRLTEALRRWARRHDLRTTGYPPTTVKDRLCDGKRTRGVLAESIAVRYDFLSPLLLKRRTSGYWRQLFDAIALGVVASDDAAAARAAAKRQTVKHDRLRHALAH